MTQCASCWRQVLIEDPVCAPDDETYECAAIKQWLSCHDTSPMRGVQLGSKRLRPNMLARRAIQSWK